MAPITDPEELKASKRKRDAEEHSNKRKRAKRDRLPSLSSSSATQKGAATLDEQPSLEKHSENHSIPVSGDDNVPPPRQDRGGPETPGRPKDRKQKHKSRVDRKASKSVLKSQLPTWKVSQPMGGRMLDIDPILTPDDKFMILAYNTSLQVYSCADSLLLRNIKLPISSATEHPEHIISACLSPSDPDLVWVASSLGRIWLINWTTGDGTTHHVKIKCDFISGMSVDLMNIGGETRDVSFVCVKKGTRWQILACSVRDGALESTAVTFSQEKDFPIHNIQSHRNGHTLVASTDRNVLLGSLSQNVTSLDQAAYQFYTFDCSDEITCLDARTADRVHLNRASQRKQGDHPVIDIVVGCARGAVFLYNDILPQLHILSQGESRHFSLQPRKYHWHRRAVHAVKWSRDGNYIISGGSESTLVLWQLDTSKMDFLPHLSASIENIVVSARGSAYVLHLDDNSAMVLSTAEMKPTMYVSGVQTLICPQPFSKDELVRRVGQQYTSRLFKTPAAINPADTSRISFCVGNGQQIGHSGSGPSTPLIQILDLNTIQSISKQALTRTNPTDINVTSTGHSITEPRITKMSYSRDGSWLATTDEWQPPSRDVDSLEGAGSERREVYLKFWSVSPEDHSLQLVSRVNAPHYSGRSEPVFDLAADPSSHRFATVGRDGVVRLWKPALRKRDGIIVKSQSGRPLQTWSCAQSIHLRERAVVADEADTLDVRSSGPRQELESGSLAFSEDGSTLVCAFVSGGGHESSAVHIIDAESGAVRAALGGLCRGAVQGIGLLGPNLIIVSDDLVVYDVVLDELVYGIQLRTRATGGTMDGDQKSKQQQPQRGTGTGPSILTHLALDHQTSSFAVAISRRKLEALGVRTELAVFSVPAAQAGANAVGPGPEPELVREFPHPVTAVVPAAGSSGFLVLDAAAQLWSVARGTETRSAFAQPLADLHLDVDVNIVAAEGQQGGGKTVAVIKAGNDDDEDEDDPEEVDEQGVDVMDVDGDDGDANADVHPAVVPPQRLAELFDAAPAFAMPPIEDMFYQVAKLFASPSAPSTVAA